jgi:hypothetical protein
MRQHNGVRTVHVVTGHPWKDAVVSLLGARSPLRPWNITSDGAPGGAVLALIDTDPVSMFAWASVVGPDGDLHDALAGAGLIGGFSGLVELSEVNRETGLAIALGDESTFRDREFDILRDFLSRWHVSDADALFGHSSLTAARVLLNSDGRCTGCDRPLNLRAKTATARIDVHTADSHSADWPAVLCMSCRRQMKEEGFSNVLDFIFAKHPRCPQCGGQRTQSALFGLPAVSCWPPWIAMMGCVVMEPRARWRCGMCGHSW